VLLTGPGAEQLYRELPPEFTGQGGFRLDTGPRGGYARSLLELGQQQIAQNPKIMDNNSSCFSGPLYIRKSDAELNLKL
jgi:hypothetical protein